MRTKTILRLSVLLVALLSTIISFSQEATSKVTGVVIDVATNEPLIGATVTEKGTHNGTITDLDGHFSLAAKANSTIVISYVGYLAQEFINDKNFPSTIQMKDDTQMLNELVVVGYGVQKKSDITGAISSVSGEVLRNAPVSSALQALQGKASGVQIIQNSGAPGAGTTIKIRGTGTVNDADPLYVVDGFIVNDITHINPNDIATMEILKDAASAAVYGARSANGVVIITTKGGESGRISINFDTYFGVSTPWKKIDVMDTENYALMRDYVDGLSNYSVDGQLYSSRNAQTGELYYDQTKFHRLDTIVKNSPKNWWDAVTQTGFKQQYNLSLSGGSEKNKFMVSANFYDEKGIVQTSGYRRFTTRVNLDNKIAPWLTAKTNVMYTNENRDIVPEGSESVLKKSLYQSPLVYTYNSVGYYTENHPIAMIGRNHNNEGRNRIDMNFSLNAKLGKYFNYQFKVSDYLIVEERSNFSEVYSPDADFVMPTDLTTIYKYRNLTNKWEVNNLFNFMWNNEIHDVVVLAGQTIEGYNNQYLETYSKGTPSNDDIYWYPSSAYTGYKNYGLETNWTAMGFVGRVNYSVLDRYLFQANFRADASSVFATHKRWGYFPSVSAGWKFSSESFLKEITWLTLGKLRLGWGQLGNNRIDEIARYTIVEQGNYNYSVGVGNHVLQPGMASISIGNSDISWEKTTTFNVGLDLGFLNNQVTASIEVFNKLTTDMLLRVPVTLSSGLVDAPMTNAGAVRNYGAELNVSYKGGRKNFKYEIGFNLSYVTNSVTSLGTGNEPIYGSWLNESSILDYVTKTEVGSPIGAFYGYVTDGIFNTYEEVRESAQYDLGKNDFEQTTRPGDFRFKDLNGDGRITAEDRTYLGSPHPDFVFGIPLAFSYKGFDLNVFLQGQTGNKIFNVMDYYLYNASNGNVYADLRDLHWSGQINSDRAFFALNTNARVPDLRSSDTARNFRASDFFVQDGSYIRLQDVRLTYNFSEQVCNKIKFKSLAIFASVYNLLTFTAYNGFDPEVGKVSGTESNNLSLGVDQGNYPQARTFTFGLRFGL